MPGNHRADGVEMLGGPRPEQLVAPRRDLEGELLVMLEACLELLLAFLDPVHFADSLSHRTAAVGNRIWRYNMAPLPRHREASTSM